jgi:hypothetical protein
MGGTYFEQAAWCGIFILLTTACVLSEVSAQESC